MNTSSTSPSKTLITAEPKPKARKRMESASASTAPSWMSFTGWRSAKRSTARSTSCRPTLMWDHRIQRAPAPSGSLVLWQDPDADLSWRATTGKGKTHGGMTTRDSHIGSHYQHRLSDQVSANTTDRIFRRPFSRPWPLAPPYPLAVITGGMFRSHRLTPDPSG